MRVLSRDETKQYDMRVFYRDRCNRSFVIGDVRNADTPREAMPGVNVGFHAAALKQVPTCEYAPQVAVRTNVAGAQDVVDVALDAAVETFVRPGSSSTMR